MRMRCQMDRINNLKSKSINRMARTIVESLVYEGLLNTYHYHNELEAENIIINYLDQMLPDEDDLADYCKNHVSIFNPGETND